MGGGAPPERNKLRSLADEQDPAWAPKLGLFIISGESELMRVAGSVSRPLVGGGACPPEDSSSHEIA